MNDGQGTNDVSRLESYVFVCMNSCFMYGLEESMLSTFYARIQFVCICIYAEGT